MLSPIVSYFLKLFLLTDFVTNLLEVKMGSYNLKNPKISVVHLGESSLEEKENYENKDKEHAERYRMLSC